MFSFSKVSRHVFSRLWYNLTHISSSWIGILDRQSTDTTRVQLAETMSLFWSYLDENGWGETGAAMTPRERHRQGPPKLGPRNTWHSLQVFSFPGASFGLNIFRVIWAGFCFTLASGGLSESSFLLLVSVVWRQLVWEQLWTFIASSVMEGLSECGQFQGLPMAVLSCLSFCFRSFPQEGMFQVLLETFAHHTLTQYLAFMNFSENDELLVHLGILASYICVATQHYPHDIAK